MSNRKRKLPNALLTGLLILLVVLLAVKIGRLLWSDKTFITAAALKEALDRQERILVLDVRPRAEYASGHIPSAKNIPLDELEVRGPNELNQEDRIVTYCRCLDDTRSDIARQTLTSSGFKDVVYLQGGLQRWEEQQYSTVRSNQVPSRTKEQAVN